MALKCPFCGGIWKPRVAKPRACPICHRYFDSERQPFNVSDDLLPRQKRIKLVEKAPLDEGYFIQCEKCRYEVDKVFKYEDKLLCRNCLLAEIDREVP